MPEGLSSVDLGTLTEELFGVAETASSGRGMHVFRAVPGGSLSQVLLVLRQGRELSEHENPGEALLHVLRGRVRLTAGVEACDLSADEHIVIPQQRHGLLALEDAAVLLTIAKARP